MQNLTGVRGMSFRNGDPMRYEIRLIPNMSLVRRTRPTYLMYHLVAHQHFTCRQLSEQ